MKLALRNLKLSLVNIQLQLDLELSGRITGIFGPSGSGKTSLLEILAGVRKPNSGFIQLGEEVIADSNRDIHIPPELRRIGYVPQDLALFPHLNVQQNLQFGARKTSNSNANEISPEQILTTLEIEGLMNRNVRSLSGGEKQRVALARALFASPRLLLLDEPLANLDERLKERMLSLLRRIHEVFTLPMLFVSHDAADIATLCDDVLVMREGQCIKHGTFEEVFQKSDRPNYVLRIY